MPGIEHFTHSALVPDNDQRARRGHATRVGWDLLLQCALPLPPPEAQVFALKEHRIVYDFWRDSMPADDALPHHNAIRPDAFAKALGRVILLEPEKAGTDFRYRIYGSHIARRFGRDMTGKRVSDFPAGTAGPMMAQYRQLLENRWGLYSEHDAPPEVSTLIRWCRLLLPFVDESGGISRILVANVPVERA